MFPSGLMGIALLPLRVSWPIDSSAIAARFATIGERHV